MRNRSAQSPSPIDVLRCTTERSMAITDAPPILPATYLKVQLARDPPIGQVNSTRSSCVQTDPANDAQYGDASFSRACPTATARACHGRSMWRCRNSVTAHPSLTTRAPITRKEHAIDSDSAASLSESKALRMPKELDEMVTVSKNARSISTVSATCPVTCSA